MRGTGRPKATLSLSTDERATLEWWARRPRSPVWLAQRSQVVLACADGLDNTEVAERIGVHAATVGKWRRRFLAERLGGLVDGARTGAPRRITDAHLEQVVVATFSGTPAGSTHQSTRRVAREVGISPASVGRAWRALGFAPWQDDPLTFARDPDLLALCTAVVGLYVHPPHKAIAVRLAGAGRKPRGDRPQPAFAGGDLLGTVRALTRAAGGPPAPSERRRARGFSAFAAGAHGAARRQDPVHLVIDASSGQDTVALRSRTGRLPGLVLHAVPTAQLWLAVASRWLVGTPGALPVLRPALEAWSARPAAEAHPFAWHAPVLHSTSEAGD